ncbi:MAG: hypothetical protein AAFX81_12255 [Pseudomonadota bacterium]
MTAAQSTAEALRDAMPSLCGTAVPPRDARRQVQLAGKSGDAALRPQLRELASTVVSEANREVVYDALHALWRLGEPRAYFLANARRHAENKWLAYFSILILGRDPNDAVVARELARIGDASRDNQIRAAVAECERSRMLRRTYGRFTRLDSRVGFILSHFRGYWNPVFFAEGVDMSAKEPGAAWLEHELRALSEEEPEAVARLICDADVVDLCSETEALSSWRGHMAGLLAPAAGDALLAMDRQQREGLDDRG